MQRKKTYNPRDCEVSNEQIALALDKAGLLTTDKNNPVCFDATQFVMATRMLRVTCYKRMRTLTLNGYLSKYGTRSHYKWSMNKDQMRWMIESTKNNECTSKIKNKPAPKKAKKRPRETVTNKDVTNQYGYLQSIGFV